MKIALVFPRFKYPSGDPPLGLAYLSSYLREYNDCEVKIIDTTFKQNPLGYIEEVFSKEKFDLVGFSVMTTMLNDAFESAKLIKKIFDVKIVFGGPHPSVMPRDILKKDFIDAVCIGEAEKTFSELIKNKLNFEGVNGIWYKKDNHLIENNPREFIENLDEIPYAAYDLLDMEAYFKNWFVFDSVSPYMRGTSMMASRGCPYVCTFCQPTLDKLFGRILRKRSPEHIVGELSYLKDKYDITAFAFQDDTFILFKSCKDWVRQFCNLLIEKGLNLLWECNVRANNVDKELLADMKKAGLRKINMGIESASQRILDDVYNKKITIEQVEQAVKDAKSLGLKIQGYFMLGAPTETLEEVKKTIDFAVKLDIDDATFSITTPLPHTYLYDKTKDLIDKDISEFDYYKHSVYKEDVTIDRKKLEKLKKSAFLRFYLSPKRIFTTMRVVFNPNIKKTLNKLKRL